MDTRNADPIWEEALEIISHMVNEGTFRIWFEPTIGLGFADGVYSVGVASEFAKDWIDARFRPLVADAVSQVVDQPTNIDIVVSPTLSRAASTETMTTPRRPRSHRRRGQPPTNHQARLTVICERRTQTTTYRCIQGCLDYSRSVRHRRRRRASRQVHL